MTTTIIICDDSSMARKQMARALPENWDVDICYANNGFEGLKAINDTQAEIMFLDLNMPEMDGYEVLQAIRHVPAHERKVHAWSPGRTSASTTGARSRWLAERRLDFRPRRLLSRLVPAHARFASTAA